MKIEEFMNDYGAKPKMAYFQYYIPYSGCKEKFCGLDIAKQGSKVNVLLSSVACSTSSVSNDVEWIAGSVYTLLRLNKLINTADDIVWYLIHLFNDYDSIAPLHISQVSLKWNGDKFIDPEWEEISFDKSPFNMSDFIEAHAFQYNF